MRWFYFHSWKMRAHWISIHWWWCCRLSILAEWAKSFYLNTEPLIALTTTSSTTIKNNKLRINGSDSLSNQHNTLETGECLACLNAIPLYIDIYDFFNRKCCSVTSQRKRNARTCYAMVIIYAFRPAHAHTNERLCTSRDLFMTICLRKMVCFIFICICIHSRHLRLNRWIDNIIKRTFFLYILLLFSFIITEAFVCREAKKAFANYRCHWRCPVSLASGTNGSWKWFVLYH